MGKPHCFRGDSELDLLLNSIPENEKSTVIRMALRQYFSRPDPLTIIPKFDAGEIEEPAEVELDFNDWR